MKIKVKVKDLERLNELIIMKGFSKTALGKEIELSQPMTVQVTNGDRNPSPKTAKRICEVLECEWSELFEIVKSPQRVGK
ncbi:helix-turn-helix transcriptional regulator [Paenibacillus sp. USDA918EY]|uniref:helix-turn-helix transcriptional regulator n=1 Tax=Paenibacillus sp. USDA918EY TaxID=2689575 RepID=UPI001357D175|nr:helix-turn-helix transcriptional regulator [Paenibacillus sp. USDA918EY]